MQETQVKQIQGITEEELEELSQLFKALGDVSRLKVLFLCSKQGDMMNAQEIGEYIEKEQPTVSSHISILRRVGIMSRRKKGLNSYYTPRDHTMYKMLNFLADCIAMNERSKR